MTTIIGIEPGDSLLCVSCHEQLPVLKDMCRDCFDDNYDPTPNEQHQVTDGGGESESYRRDMIDAGRSHLLRRRPLDH